MNIGEFFMSKRKNEIKKNINLKKFSKKIKRKKTLLSKFKTDSKDVLS